MGKLCKIIDENMRLKINNRIYELIIYDYMSSLIETSTNIGFYNQRIGYIKEDNILHVKKILIKFLEFMKHEYSDKSEAFLEADGRLQREHG